MKFIVDAQLPKSISDFLCSNGHDCIHTLDLPNKNNTIDNEIINISLKEKRIVITKDNDFLESYLISQKPEKLIIIKTGNIKNIVLIEILNKHLERILNELSYNSLIEINQTEIIIHE